jgi:hypothetical protein
MMPPLFEGYVSGASLHTAERPGFEGLKRAMFRGHRDRPARRTAGPGAGRAGERDGRPPDA